MASNKIEKFVRDNNPEITPEKLSEAISEIQNTCNELDIDEDDFIQSAKSNIEEKSIKSDIHKLKKEKNKILYDDE